VDDATVEEDGDDEAPPLVRRRVVWQFLAVREVEVDIRDAAEST
jgi:hypothetical protein